jgi:RNA polymerase sigma factor (sigma-70 family)
MTDDERNKCGEGEQHDDSLMKDGVRKIRAGMEPNAPELNAFNLELDILIHERAKKVFEWRRCPDPEGHAAELTKRLIGKLLERRFKNYDENRAFQPWINMVIRNECRDLPRREIHRKELVWKHRYRVLPLPAFKGPDEAAALKEIIPLVREAVEKLPAEHQKVILMRVYEELSRGETAGRMGLTEQTISNRMFQAWSTSADQDSR